jgi:translation initiation factor 1
MNNGRHDNKPVYSTSGGDLRKDGGEGDGGTWTKSSGPVKMRLETGGRGGKAVTVLWNLPVEEQDATKLLREMQSKFGCGGTIKAGTIELRGDVREKIEKLFAQKGMKVVRAGG